MLTYKIRKFGRYRLGLRKVKKMFAAETETHNKIPTSHTRKVKQGISGSSVFETEALTSAYGESSRSSWSASRSLIATAFDRRFSDDGSEYSVFATPTNSSLYRTLGINQVVSSQASNRKSLFTFRFLDRSSAFAECLFLARLEDWGPPSPQSSWGEISRIDLGPLLHCPNSVTEGPRRNSRGDRSPRLDQTPHVQQGASGQQGYEYEDCASNHAR